MVYKIDNRPKRHQGRILVIGIILGIMITIGGFYWFQNTPNLIKMAEQVSTNVTSQVRGLSENQPQNTDLHSIALQIHDLVNKERAANGLSILSWNEAIAQVALNHSIDMFINNYVGHIDKQGRNAVGRMAETGINCIGGYGGENMETLQGYPTNEIATNSFQDWLGDEAHKSNLLNPTYNNEGIGIYIKNGNTFVTEDFCELPS